jgi:GDP-4-dehydro-6-deoxy-D-mannose reductase
MDVRDVVRAYRLLLERGRPGHAYNISSPRIETMGALLNRLCELARVQPRIEVDPALYRPADSSPNLDAGKIAADTGWKPEIAFDQTLRDLLAEW